MSEMANVLKVWLAKCDSDDALYGELEDTQENHHEDYQYQYLCRCL